MADFDYISIDTKAENIEKIANMEIVTSLLSENNTNEELPTAKATFDTIQKVNENVSKLDAKTDNGIEALSVWNTAKGGEKSLTVNDISSLIHKCSLKLTSEDGNIYKLNEANFELMNPPATLHYYIDENGLLILDGYAEEEGATSALFYLKNLTKGEQYTFSILNNDGSFSAPDYVFYLEENGGVGGPIENTVINGNYATFTPTESGNCVAIMMVRTSYDEMEVSFYPQLVVGGSPVEKNIDFTKVKVYVNGKTYTPTADGTVTDIASVPPTMEITTDNEHVNICDFTYCVDTKKYIDNGRPYELIDTITTTEDVNEISFNTEPNGTPYNFEKVLIAMVTKQTTKSSAYSVYFNGEYAASFQYALNSSWNAHSVVELWVDKQLDKVRGRYSNHTNDWRNPNYSNVNMLFMLPKVVTSIKSIKLNCGDTVTPTGSTFEIWGVRA